MRIGLRKELIERIEGKSHKEAEEHLLTQLNQKDIQHLAHRIVTIMQYEGISPKKRYNVVDVESWNKNCYYSKNHVEIGDERSFVIIT